MSVVCDSSGTTPMAMTPEHRAKMLADTRDSAIAFFEDLGHLRELFDEDPVPRHEIRRLSAILRRWLVERDITTIGAQRCGRLMFCEPDNKPVYKMSEKERVLFFISGGNTPTRPIRALLVTEG